MAMVLCTLPIIQPLSRRPNPLPLRPPTAQPPIPPRAKAPQRHRRGRLGSKDPRAKRDAAQPTRSDSIVLAFLGYGGGSIEGLELLRAEPALRPDEEGGEGACGVMVCVVCLGVGGYACGCDEITCIKERREALHHAMLRRHPTHTRGEETRGVRVQGV